MPGDRHGRRSIGRDAGPVERSEGRDGVAEFARISGGGASCLEHADAPSTASLPETATELAPRDLLRQLASIAHSTCNKAPPPCCYPAARSTLQSINLQQNTNQSHNNCNFYIINLQQIRCFVIFNTFN